MSEKKVNKICLWCKLPLKIHAVELQHNYWNNRQCSTDTSFPRQVLYEILRKMVKWRRRTPALFLGSLLDIIYNVIRNNTTSERTTGRAVPLCIMRSLRLKHVLLALLMRREWSGCFVLAQTSRQVRKQMSVLCFINTKMKAAIQSYLGWNLLFFFNEEEESSHSNKGSLIITFLTKVPGLSSSLLWSMLSPFV